MSISPYQNNTQYLQALNNRAGSTVQNAVRMASAETGVDFAYLMEQAAVESNFDHDAQASTSSASGLYQFIESTWLSMVKDHGAKYGLEEAAAAIDDNGRVSDKVTRDDILALRNNPKIASLMAAELASDNKAYLEKNYDGAVGSTELYMAHFLGAGNASAFLNAAQDNPNTIAADVFPKAAMANRNVFFDRDTAQPRSLAQLYDFFDKKFQYDDLQQGDEIENAAPQEMRIVKRPLRDFIGEVDFQANISAARALGAMLIDDFSAPKERTETLSVGANARSFAPSGLSLFEQLQYQHSTYNRQAAMGALNAQDAKAAHDQPKAQAAISNEDFLALFLNKA
jgi:hypothetical protein